MSFPFVKTTDALTVFASNETLTSHAGTDQHDRAWALIQAGDWDHVIEAMRPVLVLADYTHGHYEIKNSTLFRGGVAQHSYVAEKLLKMYREGQDIKPWLNFLDRLDKNPSFKVHAMLFDFLQTGGLPITEDGYFLAYKRVRGDFLDFHTGTVAHNIGTYVEMPRHMVEDDPNKLCAPGLHCCSMGYLAGYGGANGIAIVVRVDPADVVSVPKEYGMAKMRVCRLFVVSKLEQDPYKANVWGTEVVDENEEALHREWVRAYDADETMLGFEDWMIDQGYREDPDADDEGEWEAAEASCPWDNRADNQFDPAMPGDEDLWNEWAAEDDGFTTFSVWKERRAEQLVGDTYVIDEPAPAPEAKPSLAAWFRSKLSH
jgi:hypothetical protein